MRCIYCRPAHDLPDLEHPELTPTEIASLVRVLVERYGLGKVRLTGGEPTRRSDLTEIISRLARIPGLQPLAMTTNGLTLARRARQYAAAGLGRVNVSLDAVRPETYARLTGVDGLERVIEGIEAARAARLEPVRLNTVVVRGHNDDELVPILRFAARRNLEIRFIELMPMGPLASHFSERYVSTQEIRRRIAGRVRDWQPLERAADAAERYVVTLGDGMRATVGLISPMSRGFCDCCNRIRIGSDGRLFPCLMGRSTGSVLPALRPALDDALLHRILTAGMAMKGARHPEQGESVMSHIGG